MVSGVSVSRRSTWMSVVTATSRIIGFARVLVVTAILGTTYLANTYIGANSLSNVAFELLAAGALSAVLVPTFAKLLRTKDDTRLKVIVSELAGFVVIALGIIAVVGVIFAPALGRTLAASASDHQTRVAQSELGTFLIRWFAPQIVLYGIGAIATAVLHARRRFAFSAAAPIASTVVMVAALVGYSYVSDSNDILLTTSSAKAWLAFAGTGGVIGFVGVLWLAAGMSGSWIVPRWPTRRNGLPELLRHATWGVLLHSIAGVLLGVAIVIGNAVSGGVVAYQTAFVFFLAPYAILALPVATAILPELSDSSDMRDEGAVADGIAWAFKRTLILVAPVSALVIALATPGVRGIAFGEIDRAGAALISSGLVALAVGLVPYSVFLLFARAYYAFSDSRTPALAAICGAIAGAMAMMISTRGAQGAGIVFRLGLSHSFGYLIGASVLGVLLVRSGKLNLSDLKSTAVPVVAATALGIVAWYSYRSVSPHGRAMTLVSVVCIGLGLVSAYGAVVLRHNRAGRPLPSNG